MNNRAGCTGEGTGERKGEAKGEGRGEEGIALFAVLLGLAVIAILALGMVLATRIGTQESHSDLESSEMRAWCDAVMLRTGVALLEPNSPRIDGAAQTIALFGQQVPIRVASEFGKVDLNVADQGSLSRLLQAAGMGPATADEQALQIVTWRGHQPFRIAAELQQVPGMTDEIYQHLAPSVTVYSGRAGIDQSVAPLLALQSVEGIDHLAAEAILRDRERSGGQQTGEVVNGRLTPGINITSWAFQIDADLTLGRRHEHATEVIRMTGDPMRPFLVLWRQETPE